MTRPKGADQTFHGQRTREKILAVIKRSEMAGYFVSVREIGDAVGLRSSSTVWNHLTKLRREGFITMSSLGQSRSIRYVRKPEEVCPHCNGSGFGLGAFNISNDNDPGTELIDDTRPPEETSFGH